MSAITYRPATLDDAELSTELMSAAYPTMVHDPIVTRYRWEHQRRGFESGRFIAELEGRPIGFVSWYHGPWSELPDRHCEVEVSLRRDELDVERLDVMWAWISERGIAEGSHLLLAYAAEDEPEMLDALARLGFERKRLEKVWELDLRSNGPRLVAEANQARRAMSREKIELTTVDAWDDPDKLHKLHELDATTRQDIPTTLPILREAFEDFVRRTNGPDRRMDRYWVALDGDRPIALSYLRYPPVKGTIWTGYTCSHPDYRGRGIARAIKLQSLAQATELGVPVVVTDNDAENAPMLHINERLGYVRRPGFVEHHKRVQSKGA
ncbi:MAG TPA: GNAT family N-acetyltransferase [Candidatus Dormibacteraeota bacterium]|nr:GNAT family N-acetyltransferase [Candidatus Dormibacteraeota bacterium]